MGLYAQKRNIGDKTIFHAIIDLWFKRRQYMEQQDTNITVKTPW
jgi:hypothetical protein